MRDVPVLHKLTKCRIPGSIQKVVDVECGEKHTVIRLEDGHFYATG